VFILAICVFMASSVLCSMAHSLGGFVVARFLQGAGGAMMTPVARLVLVRATPRSQLVEAMAWLTIPALAGPLIGPPLGGFITTFASWEWIFLINLPIGAAGIAATIRYLPQPQAFAPPPLDWPGFFLAGLAFAGVIFGMSVISLPALPPAVGITATLLGVASGLAYGAHARRAVRPILPLSLFSVDTFSASIASGSFFRIGIGAVPFLLPLMLQLAHGLSPFESGMITFIGAVGAITMKFGAVRIFRQFGFRTTLVVTGLLSAATTGAIALFPPSAGLIAGLYLMLLFSGFARSLFFTGINALAFADIDDRQAAQATAISAVAQQTSIAMGVAVAGAILETAQNLGGQELTLGAFHAAFFIVAAIMALGVLPLLAIRRDAGDEAAGRLDMRKAPDA
jgi:MFS family permease